MEASSNRQHGCGENGMLATALNSGSRILATRRSLHIDRATARSADIHLKTPVHSRGPDIRASFGAQRTADKHDTESTWNKALARGKLNRATAAQPSLPLQRARTSYSDPPGVCRWGIL